MVRKTATPAETAAWLGNGLVVSGLKRPSWWPANSAETPANPELASKPTETEIAGSQPQATSLAPVGPKTPSLEYLEVHSDGQLEAVNFITPPRAHVYDVDPKCALSATALVEAADSCEPLLWEVQRIYSDFRESLELELGAIRLSAQSSDRSSQTQQRPVGSPEAEQSQAVASPSERAKQLRSWLQRFDAEPEVDALRWIRSLGKRAFQEKVMPQVIRWFNHPPDLCVEELYLPKIATASGTAVIGLEDLDPDVLDELGVEIYECSSTSNQPFAALTLDIEEANSKAARLGLAIRFVSAQAK